MIHLEVSQVPAQLRRNYSGTKFQAEVCESMTIPFDAGVWSGGTREVFRVIRLSDGADYRPPMHDAAPWDMDARGDKKVHLCQGIAVVRHSMFCGKDMGLRFYVHPSDAAAMLPAPAAELSEHEAAVLEATCGFKSSYGGKNRRQMYNDDAVWKKKPQLNETEWEAAKAALIARGFLNKAGAVTVSGRNARPARY